MRQRVVFAVAVAVAVALTVGAAAGTILRRDRDGLPVSELLRVEPVPGEVASQTDDHLRFLSELFAGTRRITEADFGGRFTTALLDEFQTVDPLNARFDETFASVGPISFVRIVESSPALVQVRGVTQDGTPFDVWLILAEDGRIEWIEYEVDVTDPRRLPPWAASLIVLGGLTSAVAAVVAWRQRATGTAWVLVALSVATCASALLLADASAAYAIGRTVPGLTVVLAAGLLVGTVAGWRARAVLGVAAAAAVVAATAPFARDPALIGHPSLPGAFADDETLYRALLTGSAALSALALGGAAATIAIGLGGAGSRLRRIGWIAVVVAAVWALAALGSALDWSTGDGTLAGGAPTAIARSALVAVPAVVVGRLIVARWERPELATLIIDLEAEDADLPGSVATALDDPSLQLLTSPDGQVLVDETGATVSADQLPDERALTQIQTGHRLVGGLIHSAALQREPDRLEAVAAAAGLALELERLNQQVIAQLDEVKASRARIVEASDSARRQVERDLHDGAQQRLVALGLKLQRARRLAGSDDQPALTDVCDDATREVREAIGEIRAVSRGAQPALLADRGLASALEALAERLPQPVRIDITGQPLPESAERTAYYVVAEGLTNMAKHAHAATGRVSIDRHDGEACITIVDDGRGGAAISPGSGLEGLNDRIEAAGGTFDVSTGPGGTTLRATIPCG